LYIRDISTSGFALGSTIIVFSHVMECASCRDYSVFYQVHEAARMTICHSALLRGINLPALLNRYTQHNNVHIWVRGPVGQPNHRTVYLSYMQICTRIKYNIWTKERKHQSRTRKPQKTSRWKKHGERVPPTKAVVQPLGF